MRIEESRSRIESNSVPDLPSDLISKIGTAFRFPTLLLLNYLILACKKTCMVTMGSCKNFFFCNLLGLSFVFFFFSIKSIIVFYLTVDIEIAILIRHRRYTIISSYRPALMQVLNWLVFTVLFAVHCFHYKNVKNNIKSICTLVHFSHSVLIFI